MGTLTVTFHGVCSHFMGVVPGVPHRVVLPDASAFQFGLVELDDPLSPRLDYFLMPHLAVLRTGADLTAKLHVPGSVDHGNVYNGIRLQVRNAIDKMLFSDMSGLPRLTQFVPNYLYSSDVVLGGRAVCYFDIFTGSVSTVQSADGAVNVIATFETDGPPELLVTPFFPSQTPDQLPKVVAVDGDGTHSLLVANIGYACSDGQQQYDFLLHYLTAQGGIPRILSCGLPGMTDPHSLTQDELREAAKQLTEFHFPRVVDNSDAALEQKLRGSIHDTSATCSNSGYP